MEKFLASLPDRPQPLWVRMGFTLLIMGLSVLLQVGVFHITGFTAFFVLLPGIFACGLIFDRGSAFLATLIGVAFGIYVTPSSFQSIEQMVPLVLFAIIGFATAFASEALRNVMEKLIKAERAKDVLLRELDHRAHNNMMSMSSILRLQARVASHPETKNALRSSANRIWVMADVFDHLSPSSPGRAVNMKLYIESLCQKLEEMSATTGVTVRARTDQTILPEKKALPLAFIVNELVTNSLKYAFPGGRPGRVEVDLRTEEDVVLSVSDDGIGRGDNPKAGVGTRLINALADQLDATISYEDSNPGCRTTLRIPRQKLAEYALYPGDSKSASGP
jgi:two-component sensor histidine kinase